MAHPGGRPTKLTPEIIEKAQKHLDSFDVSIGTLLPTIEGLALELGVNRDTLYTWEKEVEITEPLTEEQQLDLELRQQFSDILGDLRSLQAHKLIQNSVVNRYNATIAKLLLSGKHGYVEKSEKDITSGGEKLKGALVEFVGDDEH